MAFGAYEGLVGWANPTYKSRMQGVRNARSTTSGGKSGGLFDDEGLPTRLPGTPEEALQFQFAASNWARKKNESMLANAQATMRYGLGMINKFGPYSAATMMNPLLGQMGQNYMNMQYDQPDYSYFLRSGKSGGGGGGGGGFAFSGAQADPGDYPVQMRYPQQAPVAAPAQQWPSGPLGGMIDMSEPAAAGPLFDWDTPYKFTPAPGESKFADYFGTSAPEETVAPLSNSLFDW
jgi:hypothetical protein